MLTPRETPSSPTPLHTALIWSQRALPLKIGSAISAGLRLEHSQIAPIHAIIERAPDGQLQLRALNARDNTRVNDTPIHDVITLHHGDKLSFAAMTFWLDLNTPDTIKLNTSPQPCAPTHAPSLSPTSPDLDLDQLEAQFFAQAPSSPTPEAPPSPRTLEISLCWRGQLISARTYHSPAPITLGVNPRCDYPLELSAPALKRFAFMLYHPTLRCWCLRVHPSFQGAVQSTQGWHPIHEHPTTPLSPVRHSPSQESLNLIPIDLEADGIQAAELHFGEVTLLVRHSPCAPRFPQRLTIPREDLRFIGLSATMHSLTLALLLSLPSSAELLSPALPEHEPPLVSFITPPPLAPPSPPTQETLDTLGDGQDTTLDAKRAGDEGQLGAPTLSPEHAGKLSISTQPTPTKQLTTPTTTPPKDAKTAGVLGILSTAPGAAQSTDLLAGLDGQAFQDALGQLATDAPVAAARGELGLGLSHSGRGGAGDDEQALGIGRMPTQQRAAQGGQGITIMPERGQLSVDLLVTPTRTPRPAQLKQDCLSTQTISRVVRAKQAQLRACYERALIYNKELKGQLSLELTIDPNGKITHAQANADTIKSERVTQCVLQTMRSLHFPAYTGCQRVVANYPLRFAPSTTTP